MKRECLSLEVTVTWSSYSPQSCGYQCVGCSHLKPTCLSWVGGFSQWSVGISETQASPGQSTKILSTQPQMGHYVSPSHIYRALWKKGRKEWSAGRNRRGEMLRTWVYILSITWWLHAQIGFLNTVIEREGGLVTYHFRKDFTQLMVVGGRDIVFSVVAYASVNKFPTSSHLKRAPNSCSFHSFH